MFTFCVNKVIDLKAFTEITLQNYEKVRHSEVLNSKCEKIDKLTFPSRNQ